MTVPVFPVFPCFPRGQEIGDCPCFPSFLYSLDDAGNRTAVEEASGDLVTYSYDDAYQLTREQRSGANAYDITFTYDAVGNRLTKLEGGDTTTYSYDAANQIETQEDFSGITTFTFDNTGNLVVEVTATGRTTYSWDLENMSTGIVLPNSSRNTFAYDADLKRRQAQDSDGTAVFVNDLENVLLETNNAGGTQVAYTLEPAGYGNLLSQRRSGATAFHYFDALGSTDRLTDADEDELASYVNSAFGVPLAATGNHPNRLRFVGRLGYRWEPDASQYDVRRRRYAAARGEWISRDPAASVPGGYVYATDNPGNRDDPSGLICQASHFGTQLDVGSCAESIIGLANHMCEVQHDPNWELSWQLPAWDSEQDCAVFQFMSHDFGPWVPDAKLGWPYPHSCATVGSKKLCYQADMPHWMERVFRQPFAVMSYISEFVTCLCGKDPYQGPLPLVCYKWTVAACETDCVGCRTLYCLATGPVRSVPGPVSGLVQRACLNWYLS